MDMKQNQEPENIRTQKQQYQPPQSSSNDHRLSWSKSDAQIRCKNNLTTLFDGETLPPPPTIPFVSTNDVAIASLNNIDQEQQPRHLQSPIVRTWHNGVPCHSLSVVVHTILFATFAGSYAHNIWWDITKLHIFPLLDYIYLTHWNLTFQVFFCALALTADLSPTVAIRTATFREKLYHSIIFPFRTFVFAFFLMMCAVDERLVRLSDLNDRSEAWYNHVVLTLIVPAVLLQGMVTYYRLHKLIESYSIMLPVAFAYRC